MRSIGVRELRQQASRYLRQVEAGETIQVTDHGRPVALLVPVPTDGALSLLVASGRLAPAEGDLLELGEPLEPQPGVPLPSEELERLRESER
jgi:prevent-host-death family protein